MGGNHLVHVIAKIRIKRHPRVPPLRVGKDFGDRAPAPLPRSQYRNRPVALLNNDLDALLHLRKDRMKVPSYIALVHVNRRHLPYYCAFCAHLSCAVTLCRARASCRHSFESTRFSERTRHERPSRANGHRSPGFILGSRHHHGSDSTNPVPASSSPPGRSDLLQNVCRLTPGILLNRDLNLYLDANKICWALFCPVRDGGTAGTGHRPKKALEFLEYSGNGLKSVITF